MFELRTRTDVANTWLCDLINNRISTKMPLLRGLAYDLTSCLYEDRSSLNFETLNIELRITPQEAHSTAPATRSRDRLCFGGCKNGSFR